MREDLIFHGGTGATLEMREFGMTQLERKLLASGFREVYFLKEVPRLLGILFAHDLSQPLPARKEPYVMSSAQRAELVAVWRGGGGPRATGAGGQAGRTRSAWPANRGGCAGADGWGSDRGSRGDRRDRVLARRAPLSPNYIRANYSSVVY